jgi:hypothetical protein
VAEHSAHPQSITEVLHAIFAGCKRVPDPCGLCKGGDFDFVFSFLETHAQRLKGNREGQHSIRINDQWRLCFAWHDGNAYEVEIVDYH